MSIHQSYQVPQTSTSPLSTNQGFYQSQFQNKDISIPPLNGLELKNDHLKSTNNLLNKKAQSIIVNEKDLKQDSVNQQQALTNQEEQRNDKIIFTVYIMFCIVAIQNNFNTGVIPASLIQIENELHLNFSQQATLGSLEYLGISIASFIVPVAFNKYKISQVLAVTSLFNGLFSLLIALSSSILIIYFARLGQGFCAAFGTIYGPIWVNHFSPPESSSTWLGILQSFVPLGVMLGYSSAALLITLTGSVLSWRIGFFIMLLITIFTTVFFVFIDNQHIDILYFEKEALKSNSNNQNPVNRKRYRYSHAESEINDSISIISHSSNYGQGCIDTLKQFGVTYFLTISYFDLLFYSKPILRHHIFIYVCFGICILFYIVTGIQYWTTQYFVKFAGVSQTTAMASFSFLAITAPVIGAIVGGSISDSLGGYKGKSRITALKYCISVGMAALIFSIPIGYVTEFWQIAIFIWFLLCFGGALVPSGTGICLSCLPKQYHSTCSSLAQLIYNVFGYFLCPLVSGTIMDLFHDQLQGLIWGWRSILVMGIIAPFLFIKALINEQNVINQEEDQNYESQQQKKVPNLESEKRTKAWSVM